MNDRTLNPFLMFGSYVGLLIGIFLSLQGWHIFWWLPPLFGMRFSAPIELDAAGGFIAGYISQILWRVFNYHAGRVIAKKK
ncbi:MAG TPA: hypothetical protein VMC41_03925 [Candidatus Nanoarchaeia archaeon]|nr:hypothetical protein [Candidatus Nanoarchaeia archaeon]